MPPEALTIPPHYSSKLDCFSLGVLTIQIITRNFPAPGDAHQSIEDPSRFLLVQVREVERRKKDIDLVEHDHPLLPIALDCIKDRDKERPSADEVCERLVVLKSKTKSCNEDLEMYSMEQDQSKGAEPQEQENQGERIKHKDQFIPRKRAMASANLEEVVPAWMIEGISIILYT